MRPYINGLSQEEKFSLKDLVAHKGINILIDWLFMQKAKCPIIALESAANMEEVKLQKGRVEGFQETVAFLQDAMRDLHNYGDSE